jgi:epoxyqueuosine reductase
LISRHQAVWRTVLKQTAKPNELRQALIAQAAGLGLDAVGIARVAGDTLASQRLRTFLADGRHGDMAWMAETADRRADPTVLWPEACTAIMIGHSYAPASDPRYALNETTNGVISVYAHGRDYHDVLKGKIKQLASQFAKTAQADVKVFVDTAPLMEKPLAARAGLGWQGKHTNLVSRAHGSWLFLGAILTTAELEPDPPEVDHCGSCQRCVDICPTQAFPAPYQLDARRCLAYLTIEHQGTIPREFRRAMANRVFGCDDCLAVCPWNKFAEVSREAKYAALQNPANPALAEFLALDDGAFRKRFAGTPVKRTGRNRIVRNALIAAANSGDASLLPEVRNLLRDPSPLVRAMAVWAVQHLADEEEIAQHRRFASASEPDCGVMAEWLNVSKEPAS